MATKLGRNCKLYVGSTLIAALSVAGVETALETPTDLLGPVRTVTLNLQADRQDITTRANSGWKQYAQGLKDGSIEFELNSTDDAATIVDIIQTAYFAGSAIAVAALDGVIAVVGTTGLTGNYIVTNFTRNEPIEGAVSYSVQLSPDSYTYWYEKTA